jgi:hypothetical protein
MTLALRLDWRAAFPFPGRLRYNARRGGWTGGTLSTALEPCIITRYRTE